MKTLDIKMKSVLVLVLVLLAFSTFVFAQSDFEIEINSLKNDIYEDDVALYELIITNNAEFIEYFEIPSTYEVDWITYTEPGVIMVPARSTEKFNLSLDPKSTVLPQQHQVLLSLQSGVTGEFKDFDLFVYIRSLNEVFPGYKASIALSVDIPYEIDPRNDVPVTIYMRNRNALNVEDMSIVISSDLINEEKKLPLAPLEENSKQFRFKLSKTQEPRTDSVYVALIIRNVTVNQRTIPIKILPYTKLVDEVVFDKFLLKRTKEITITNEGNVFNDHEYLIPVEYFENLFTSTKPKTETVLREQRFRVYTPLLGPEEQVTIRVVTNYRYILYFLIMVTLLFLAYYTYRSPLIVKKEIIPVRTQAEGVHELKVRILIKNRTRNAVENTRVIEMIPGIASVLRETQIGTIEPSKVIKHDKKGTLLKWDINYIEPYEERIITYGVTSKIGIVGGLTLPKTKVKYEMFNGRERVTYSRRQSINV